MLCFFEYIDQYRTDIQTRNQGVFIHDVHQFPYYLLARMSYQALTIAIDGLLKVLV